MTFANRSAHPWLEREAPRQLDADCIWILESGRAMCNPADGIVLRRKREKIFDIDANRTLEDHADYFYRRKLGFKEMGKDNPCTNESWVKQMETTSGRNRIACMRFGYFALPSTISTRPIANWRLWLARVDKIKNLSGVSHAYHCTTICRQFPGS